MSIDSLIPLIHRVLLLFTALIVTVSPVWAQNNDDSSVLQVEHVNTVEEPEPEPEPEEEQISVPQTSADDEEATEKVSEESSEESDEVREGETVESTRVPETTPAPPAPVVPEVSKARTDEEAISLKKLVRELQYGSLENSIKLLETMVKAYPYDPDYRALLSAARNLNNADIWYRYQRRLQLPPPSAHEEIKKLVKVPRKEEPINELKRESWFLLIKNGPRQQR
ncbi:MAG: hypothetical protein H6677_06820 [Candidatus Obscuribacterales bacterium]|nr:hypothetical protein [Cyanobacteria bacterium HKST-UBA01]MCB9467975.1 hypothetical protein [Candidatus Obscuribacterales bacterium]